MQSFTDEQLKKRFLEVLLRSGALRFGDFLTKSGRRSPYFFNSGLFASGALLNEVASAYALLIKGFLQRDGMLPERVHLYGPAYKGISLAVASAMELARVHDLDATVTFNRKEAKDHGEGGHLIGHPLTSLEGPLVIVEDVVTGGVSARESIELLRHLGAKPVALVVGVDRQERGRDERRASRELAQDFGLEVLSLLTVREVFSFLAGRSFLGRQWIDDDCARRIEAYWESYGA